MIIRSSHRSRVDAASKGSLLGRLLDPIDQLSEAIYSILIVLTFTLAFRIITFDAGIAQTAGGAYVGELLVGALGATLAWGLIDGLIYALMAVFERGERHRLLHQIQRATSDSEAVLAIAGQLDFILEPITGEHERSSLYRSVLEHLRDSRPQPVQLTREDLAGVFGSVLIALAAALPPMVPFLQLSSNVTLAIRISNIVSFVLLFLAGFRWGQYTGSNPWKSGLLLAAAALVMVLIASRWEDNANTRCC